MVPRGVPRVVVPGKQRPDLEGADVAVQVRALGVGLPYSITVSIFGGTAPAVFNAANEEAVHGFLAGRGTWLGIVDTVAEVLAGADGWSRDPVDVADVLAAEGWARARAGEVLDAARA